MFWGLCVKTQCGPIRVSRLSHRTRHLFQVSLLASLHSWNRVKPMLIRKRNFLCDCGSLRSSPIDHRWWKSPSFHQTSLCPELGIVCTEWYLIFCELLKREKKTYIKEASKPYMRQCAIGPLGGGFYLSIPLHQSSPTSSSRILLLKNPFCICVWLFGYACAAGRASWSSSSTDSSRTPAVCSVAFPQHRLHPATIPRGLPLRIINT